MMAGVHKVTIIGGGSLLWSFGLGRQFISDDYYRGAHLWLMDLHAERLELVAAALRQFNSDHGSPVQLHTTTDLDESLESADFVIVAISTGGLAAMTHDLTIAEQYDIWHTVGDTVGPGGWNRAMRNVPVFENFARRMTELCPHAWMLNMSNPLTPLTRVPEREYGIPVIGMCPGVDDQARAMARLVDVPDEQPLELSVAGVDHSSYFVTLESGNGVDVLAALRRAGYCTDSGDLPVDAVTDDGMVGQTANRQVFALWKRLGYLPAISDRHAVENHTGFVNGNGGRLPDGLVRTVIADRQARYDTLREALEQYLASPDRTRLGRLGHGDDPVGHVIRALSGGPAITLTANVANTGQTPEAPRGAVVETRCRFDAAGVHPAPAPIPMDLRPLLLPLIDRQEACIDIALRGNFTAFVDLLAQDPLCSHLTRPQVREMAQRLLDATRDYIQNPSLLAFQEAATPSAAPGRG